VNQARGSKKAGGTERRELCTRKSSSLRGNDWKPGTLLSRKNDKQTHRPSPARTATVGSAEEGPQTDDCAGKEAAKKGHGCDPGIREGESARKSKREGATSRKLGPTAQQGGVKRVAKDEQVIF